MKTFTKWSIVFGTALIWGMFLLYWVATTLRITGIE